MLQIDAGIPKLMDITHLKAICQHEGQENLPGEPVARPTLYKTLDDYHLINLLGPAATEIS